MTYRKYIFRKYNASYLKLFKKEKNKLTKILPRGSEIEHVGSTSMPGIGGKGVIDILIGIKDIPLNNIKKILINANYTSSIVRGLRDKLSFEREDGFFIKRKFHVHLTKIGSRT